MRWLAPWGDHLRSHEKIREAPRVALIIAEIVGGLVVLVTVIVIAFQIWVKNAGANSKSFYGACTLGDLSGGLHWAWYFGFGGGTLL